MNDRMEQSRTTEREADCTCCLSAVNPCPMHGELRDHATSLRLRLDTDRNDQARSDLYAALQAFEQAQIAQDRRDSPPKTPAPVTHLGKEGDPIFTACGFDRANVRHWTWDVDNVTCKVCQSRIRDAEGDSNV